MNIVSVGESLQLGAWSLLVVDFILAIYILLLNPRHTANRHIGAILLLFATNIFSTGLLLSARQVPALAMALNAATVPALQPGLLLASIVLVKPEWMRGRWRPLSWALYGLILLPMILTLVDLASGSGLWYTPPDPATHASGFLSLSELANGTLGPIIRILNVYLMGLAPIVLLLYVVLLDKSIAKLSRRLAWLLLGAEIAVVTIQFGLNTVIGAAATALISATLFSLTYAYAGFQQIISERRAQRGQLQSRLILLSLAITVPLIVAAVAIVSAETRTAMERRSEEQLAATNRALASNLQVWLDLNLQSLQQLVTLPDIVSMDAGRQKPVLEAMASAFPHMYLVSTTDLNGINIARNDEADPKDYSDRPWVRGALGGAPLTFQTLIGRTSGEPALVASMPIRDQSGEIVGVGMFASDLTVIADEVLVSRIGETGFAYVVNDSNQVLAHPDPAFSAELKDLSDSPPIVALRQGTRGQVSYTEGGQRWRAYVDELAYGWGVVVQLPETALLADMQGLWIVAGVVAAGGILLLITLTWLTVRQATRPISALTETAAAISAGNLDHAALVESEDEIGALARAFNSMTDRLRELIGSLEQQVADRTQSLEQRSAYLEATTEVSRAAASILEVERLTQQVVELIRERFGLYYVGLFLADEAREWAVLRTGTGEAGRAMLARGHRIKVGEGMVGWSLAHGQPRVAMEVGEDAVRLATAELPETRSEAALPLRSRGQVIGALTVQHTEPGAFDQDTLAVFQVMADQVAVAVDNARLFAESQSALEAARRAYGQVGREAWRELLRSRTGWGYRYAGRVITPVNDDPQPEMFPAEQDQGRAVKGQDRTTGPSLTIPLTVGGEVVGSLGFRKGKPDETWTSEQTELLEALAGQLELALESARLFEETQRRAARERLVGEVATRVRETLDLETMLRTAASEMRQALNLDDIVVRLAPVAQASDQRE